jgi:hypothetical protein
VEADGFVIFAESNAAEEGGEVAFFSCGVDQSAGCEGCGVEGAEAGAGDEKGEDEGAGWAEDLGAECDGYCVGGVDDGGGEDQEVGYVGEDIAEDDEWERGV